VLDDNSEMDVFEDIRKRSRRSLPNRMTKTDCLYNGIATNGKTRDRSREPKIKVPEPLHAPVVRCLRAAAEIDEHSVYIQSRYYSTRNKSTGSLQQRRWIP
jgi:hypothetical protein